VYFSFSSQVNVRLQKFLADAGVASRRASETLITQGQVTVNGKMVTELGTRVDPDHDEVAVEGRKLRARKRIYLALNKPAGYLCTRSDELARQSVMDLLPKEWSIVYPVGRLDKDSEGLLFLTNDGEFCLRLTHPRFGVHKRYIATVMGKVDPSLLDRFCKGIQDHGELLRVQRAWLISANSTRSVIELELAEGKNREVRRLFESQNFTVERLQRVQIGSIRLGELPLGKWRILTAPEIAAFGSSDPAPKASAGAERASRPRSPRSRNSLHQK
jgi:23S rRNA pseudouridine2605 synthase